MNKFSVLRNSDPRSSDKRLAKWPDDEEIEFEKVSCTVNPDGHRGVRDRITTPLCAILPDIEPYDFVWNWIGDCLIRGHVVEALESSDLTGFSAIPAKVRYKNPQRASPALWELSVYGSAGLASALSGLDKLYECPGCGLTDYSQVTTPSQVVNSENRDGSDFFRVEPFSRLIFISHRAVEFLESKEFTGCQIKSLDEMKEYFDIVIPARN